MKTSNKGEKRRQALIALLKQSCKPKKGTELAQQFGVSRQVIVTDIALLKKELHPILSTHDGYLYHAPNTVSPNPERSIYCYHKEDLVEKELKLLVDLGVTVKDVQITHPIYGEICAPIQVSTRKNVEIFLKEIEHQNAAFLLQLTNGYHRHTISAPSEELLYEAEKILKENGILWINTDEKEA